MLGLYLFLASSFTGSFKVALSVPLIGYFFAWVGHFYFEQNRPASFLAATYRWGSGEKE